MRQLGVFARYWEPGRVKTRLAARIGDVSAARVHRAFLESTLRRFAASAERRVLAFTPAQHAAEFQPMAGNHWRIDPQSEGDLGRRMHDYFQRAFSAGAHRAVLIGADSPTLPTAYVEQAFERLDEVPLVLGPAADGGYYLVGAADSTPPIFERIDWGGPQVWRQTLERVAAWGRPFADLPEWYDIDTYEDLLRLRCELRHAADDDVRLLLTVVEEALRPLLPE